MGNLWSRTQQLVEENALLAVGNEGSRNFVQQQTELVRDEARQGALEAKQMVRDHALKAKPMEKRSSRPLGVENRLAGMLARSSLVILEFDALLHQKSITVLVWLAVHAGSCFEDGELE
ncbi:hypothetical protein DVH05_002850 [Phytophthora capsici]|nr:hypothetical protein DVH05_002850 [Phytophthora capsici]